MIALRSVTGNDYQRRDITGLEGTYVRSKGRKVEKRKKKEQTKWVLQEYGRKMRLRFRNIERREHQEAVETPKAVQQDFLEDSQIKRIKWMQMI